MNDSEMASDRLDIDKLLAGQAQIVGAGEGFANPAAIVIQAIIKAKIAIGTLTKDAKNPFHRYNYVPIDAYYEHVASRAAEEGLTWRTNLKDLSVFSEGVDDRGRPTSILRFEFSIDLMHVSGVVYDNWQAITILHPVQGAQTTGSALSYAEKLFMRTTFSVTTSEDDVDAKNSDFKPQAGPQTRSGPPIVPVVPALGPVPVAGPPPAPKVVTPVPVRGRPPKAAEPPRAPTLAELEAANPSPAPVVIPPPPNPPGDEPPPAPEPTVEPDDSQQPAAPSMSEVAVELVKEMDRATNTPILVTDETLAGKLDVVAEIMSQFIGFCDSDAVLNQFWRNNLVPMKMLEKAEPEMYLQTVNIFRARRAALAGK